MRLVNIEMMKKFVVLALAFLWASNATLAQDLEFDRTRARDLSRWKPQMEKYSLRHYGEATWRLDPTCIVLHYTVSKGYPWNLTRNQSFGGETPGIAVHYVIDGEKIWEVLPPNVRSRGCYGINHRGINIEMVAMHADDLATKTKTLETCQKLCRMLMSRYGIEKSHIYSHQDVAAMSRKLTPEALDLVNGTPYHKIDPGVQNMETVLGGLKSRY